MRSKENELLKNMYRMLKRNGLTQESCDKCVEECTIADINSIIHAKAYIKKNLNTIQVSSLIISVFILILGILFNEWITILLIAYLFFIKKWVEEYSYLLEILESSEKKNS